MNDDPNKKKIFGRKRERLETKRRMLVHILRIQVGEYWRRMMKEKRGRENILRSCTMWVDKRSQL